MEYVLLKLIRIKARLFTLLMSACFGRIGTGSVISPPLRFGNLRGVRLGNNVIINSNCWIQTVKSRAGVVPVLEIHDNASIGMNATLSAAQRIEIGRHVLLGRNVFITDHNHEFRDVKLPVQKQGITVPAPVTIGDETWIGQNAVILPGANIGRHCVIGANSVVTGVIPDFCVAAGAPARVIRRYNPDSKVWESEAHVE
jgi:acetyltransferase-like isoleucine patch superfamily enzyme